jgi:lipopolysaccharide transport system permease protein
LSTTETNREVLGARPAAEAEEPVALIGPPRGWSLVDLRELWEFRELLAVLAGRDLRARYKQTAFGVGWAVLQPLLVMATFTLVFGVLARVPTEGTPYPLFAMAGLLPWNCFSQTLGRVGASLVNNSNLVCKVYFPRLIIPLSSAVTPLVDFTVCLVVLLAMMAWYGIAPTWRVLAIPALALASSVVALSAGLWLTALHVRYRDVGYLVPVFLQVLMFLSPVGYSPALVPERWRPYYDLNPVSGVIEGFRWALLGGPGPSAWSLWANAAGVLVVLLGGALYFRRTEESLVDVI